MPFPRNEAPFQEQFSFQKFDSTAADSSLDAYNVIVAGNSTGVFAVIMIAEDGTFDEMKHGSDIVASFGAQVIRIVEGSVFVGGSIGMATGGFCPLIMKVANDGS